MSAVSARNANSPVLQTASRRLGALDWIALILMIVGGLNWAAVGLLNVDLVAAVFGPLSIASRVVYVVVGLAALYGIAMLVRFGAAPAGSASPAM